MTVKVAWIIEKTMSPTGAYFQQTYLMANYLNDFGVESVVANPDKFDERGEEVLQGVYDYKPDVIITFGDTHLFAIAEKTGIPVLAWYLWGSTEPVPFDGPVPLVTFACVARSTQNMFADVGIDARYIPHAYDPNIFHRGRRRSARARLGWTEERPTVLMVGTNLNESAQAAGPPRKNWAGALDAFALVLEEVPDAILYAHTNNFGGLDIPAYAKEIGIADSVRTAGIEILNSGYPSPLIAPGLGVVSSNYPPEYVADLYRASDVLLLPSLAEGFGVPLIEAQACGIPVVATDAPPMDELVKFGTRVKSIPHPDRFGWALPDTNGLADALVHWLYGNNERYHAVDEYSAEAVVEDYFLPALTDVVKGA